MSAELRERNRYLEDENRYLREFLAPTQTLPLSWKLSAAETRLVICIAKASGVLSKDRIRLAVGMVDRDPTDKTLEVILVRMRRKLAPLGIEILTVHAVGLTMHPEGRAIVRDALAAVTAGTVA